MERAKLNKALEVVKAQERVMALCKAICSEVEAVTVVTRNNSLRQLEAPFQGSSCGAFFEDFHAHMKNAALDWVHIKQEELEKQIAAL